MSTKRKTLVAEIERVRGEYEAALAEVAAAEQEHMIEISRLAGQEALNEITREDGRAKRQVLDADLAERGCTSTRSGSRCRRSSGGQPRRSRPTGGSRSSSRVTDSRRPSRAGTPRRGTCARRCPPSRTRRSNCCAGAASWTRRSRFTANGSGRKRSSGRRADAGIDLVAEYFRARPGIKVMWTRSCSGLTSSETVDRRAKPRAARRRPSSLRRPCRSCPSRS